MDQGLTKTGAALALLLSACGGAAASSGGTTAAEERAPSTFEAQVAAGGQLYGEHCASCHGASGEGTDHGPRVVGLAEGAFPLEPHEGSQRTSRFVTVADVATFVVAAMPANAPGSLPAADYWSILAFDLHANGVDLQQPLTPELAATLTIPR